MTEQIQDFSPTGYSDLLSSLLSRGFTFSLFGLPAAFGRKVYIRHDVDLSLDAALAMAKLERGLGIRSTYLVMLGSEFYNPSSRSSVAAVREILSCGHQVGLHIFGRQPLSNQDTDLQDQLENEFKIARQIFGPEIVEVFSFHNPTPAQLAFEPTRYIFTHGCCFRKNVKYISDSRMIFREGPPREMIQRGRFPSLQVLIHPEFWMFPGKFLGELIENYLSDLCSRTRTLLLHDFDGTFENPNSVSKSDTILSGDTGSSRL